MNMKREDDGSLEWFDQVTRQRIRGGHNAAQQNTGSKYQFAEINPDTVTDPQLKEQLQAVRRAGLEAKERYVKTWHAGPAHLGGKVIDPNQARDYAVTADVDQISTAIEAKHMQQRQLLNEVDSAEMQLQRLPGSTRGQAMNVLNSLQHRQTAFPQHNLVRLNEIGNGNFMQPQQTQQQGPQVCKLLEGHPCFRALQTAGFGSNLVMARAVGQIVSQIAMQEFVVKGIVNVFIVPPNQTVVDINIVQRNPQLCTQLVEISNPHLGSLLVPKEALGIATTSPYGQQKTILTDSRQRQQQPTQQMLLNRAIQHTPQTAGGRGMLKG